MMKFPLAVLCLMGLAPEAGAGQSHVLHGLFCNSQAQVEEALGHMRRNMTMATAVALTNREEVACVYATRLRYMVVDAVVASKIPRSGTALKIYSATLVGILVGDNPRPIVPSMPIYFVTQDPMPDVPVLEET